jgi:hypothetical protein
MYIHTGSLQLQEEIANKKLRESKLLKERLILKRKKVIFQMYFYV